MNRCLTCGSLQRSSATQCWLCGQVFLEQSPFKYQAEEPSRKAVWILVGFIITWGLVLIGIGLGLSWPGLLVLYALIALPTMAVVGRIVWVERFDFWNERDTSKKILKEKVPFEQQVQNQFLNVKLDARGNAVSSPSSEKSTTEKVITGAALSFAAIGFIIGMLILFLVIATGVAFILCLIALKSP